MFNSLRLKELQPTRILCAWDSPGKNTGMGCHFLLQGIFPNQGWNSIPLSSLAFAGGSFTISATFKQGKNLQDQLNEEEMCNLFEKKRKRKFRVRTVKMIQDLRNRIEI